MDLTSYMVEAPKADMGLFLWAAQNGDLDTLQQGLLQDDRKIIEKDPISGRSALMLAAMNGHVDCVKLLIKYEKSNFNVCDVYGMTALMHASRNGHVNCLKVLMEHDVNLRDDDGRTALMYATDSRCVECVNVLIQCERTDVNARDNEGRTALMLSSTLYDDHSCKCTRILILNERVNSQECDESGTTAFMMAMKQSNIECLQCYFCITVLEEKDFTSIQNKHAYKEVLSNTLYYNSYDGCTLYMPDIEWRSPYIYGRDQNEKSILKLVVRSGLHRCLLCFILNGSDVAMSENIPCTHRHLEKIQCCVWDEDRRMEFISLASYYKGNFKEFEYCIQFHRIRFHVLVILFQETIGKSDTISLALYQRLCGFIYDNTDIDRFLRMLYNCDDIGECVDYLLSVFLCQIVSRIIPEERHPRLSVFDSKVRLCLVDHIKDKHVLRRFLEMHPLEYSSQEFRVIIILISLSAGVFFWEGYPGLSSVDKRIVIQELVMKSIAPEHFRYQCRLSSAMHDAFICRDDGLLRYLVVNFYFAPHDFDILQGENIKRLIFDQTLPRDFSRLYLEHVKPPWRLERLSMLALSRWLRHNTKRGDIDNNKVLSMLPEIFRSRLVAENKMQLIDVNQWECIDLEFLNHRLTPPLG